MVFEKNDFDKFARVEQIVQRRFDKRQGGVAAPHPKRIDVFSPIVPITNVNDEIIETFVIADMDGVASTIAPVINFTNSDANNLALKRLGDAEFFKIGGASLTATSTGIWNGDFEITFTYRLDGTAHISVPITRRGIVHGASATVFWNLLETVPSTPRMKTTFEQYDNTRDTILKGKLLSIDLFSRRNSGTGTMALQDVEITLELFL